MITEKDLLALKSQVDDAKSEIATLKGKLQYLNQQLLDEWGCKTVAEAQKKLQGIQKEIETANTQINTGLEELEVKYGEFINN